MASSRNVRNNRFTYGRRPEGPPRGRRIPNPGAFKSLLVWAATLVVLFLVWNYFSINSIEISGNRTVSTSSLLKLANASFGNHPFARNLLTLGFDPLDKDLLADQHLGSVKIERHWPQTLRIVVTERLLQVVWKTSGQAFLIDVDGMAVARTEGGEHLPSVSDSTGLPVQVGDRVAPPRFIRFVTDVNSGLTGRTKLQIADMTIPDTTSELYVKTTAGYIIKFDTTSGAEEQLVALTQVLATLTRLTKTPAEYIDLRIPNKAYYR